MSNEKYPMIKFSHREQDNLRTEGGNSKDLRKWVLEGQALENKSETLVDIVNNVKENLNDYPEGIPHTLEVNFIDDAKAKSYQKPIIDMFITNEKYGQIGMSNENTILIDIASKDSLDKISSNIKDVLSFQIPISAVSNISKYSPVVVEGKENVSTYKINFFDFQDLSINNQVFSYIFDVLSSRNIFFEDRSYAGNQRVLEIKNAKFDKLKFIKNLPIKSLEPMAKSEGPFHMLDSINLDVESSLVFDPKKRYPTVGLLDSGVSLNDYTLGWVKRGKGSVYEDSELDTTHGTFIASLLIHGNELNNVSDYAVSGCNIVDVPVVPKNGVDEITLINNIKRAVENNPEVKVWNLSVSLEGEISTDKFSDFAVALDKIQDDYAVLICKSAGNDSKFFEKEEVGNLSLGAESVRSLTVGSLTRNSDEYEVSKENHPSLYSRKGRGPGYIIKPELCHFGGDLSATTFHPVDQNDFFISSETGITSDGRKSVKVGTSFSTPKIAKNIAELANGLSGEFDPLMLKALITHSAKYGESPALSGEERLEKLGYGKPLNSNEILVSDSEFSTTLVLRGNLEKGKRIDIMDFPYPKNLVEDGKFKGRIKATLVYNNYLEKELGSEYCQSNMVFRFGTYESKFDRDTTKKTILNPIGRKNSENMLNKKLYSKKKVTSNFDYATDRMLIQYGDKYYPVKKFSADLSELKPKLFNSALSSNRSWYLYLEGQYRDFIMKKAKKSKETLSMDYCVIITISDPDRKANVFGGTVQELSANNFRYNSMEIVNEVTISI
ncbi:S8 family peptidase [Enterococcus faecalis]|uniref:S8 family peptidase n=1 Tax=Enterococcus faecalis TaxID=1351 RepID=UPI003F903B67